MGCVRRPSRLDSTSEVQSDSIASPRKRPLPFLLKIGMWWLMTIAWAAEMFHLSTEAFGGSHSQAALMRLLYRLHVSISPYTLHLVNFLMRKFAHLTEYAILSFLLYRSFGGRNPFDWWPAVARWCIAIAGAYALTDELHQAYVPGRTASIIDCGIDATGAALAMLLVYLCLSQVRESGRRPLRGS